jgi:hypothetical protein
VTHSPVGIPWALKTWRRIVSGGRAVACTLCGPIVTAPAAVAVPLCVREDRRVQREQHPALAASQLRAAAARHRRYRRHAAPRPRVRAEPAADLRGCTRLRRGPLGCAPGTRPHGTVPGEQEGRPRPGCLRRGRGAGSGYYVSVGAGGVLVFSQPHSLHIAASLRWCGPHWVSAGPRTESPPKCRWGGWSRRRCPGGVLGRCCRKLPRIPMTNRSPNLQGHGEVAAGW